MKAATMLLPMILALPLAAQAPADAALRNRDVSLEALLPLFGDWRPPRSDERVRQRPELLDQVVHSYRWTVGRQAIRVLEGFPAGRPEEAELDGMIFWNPATEQIEFVSVAGGKPGQGRLFQGRYRVLADGRIERVYTVTYRTLADVPGENLGGLVRRYREIYTVSGDSLDATLDWWRDGAWKPFAVGRYSLERRG